VAGSLQSNQNSCCEQSDKQEIEFAETAAITMTHTSTNNNHFNVGGKLKLDFF
jgi:hypothetical protein